MGSPSEYNASRQMWQIALPAIVTNISIPLLGLVDTFIMGHLPDPRYLGAIALGAMVISILFNSMNFLRMATTGFTAQANGKDDTIALSHICLRAAICAVVIGALFILLQWPIAWAALSLTSADSDVEALAMEYFMIRIWGAPFAMINFVAVGWLLGLHKAQQALWIQIFMNISNICLNFLFVYGFGMDVDGVALGTVISEFLAFLYALYLVSQTYNIRTGYSVWARPSLKGLFDRTEFSKLFVLNRDIFLRTACLTGAMASFTILGAGMGKTILAANAIMMNLQMVTSYGLDGFAQAAEVMVGKEIGRKSRQRLRQAVIISSKWALITAALFSAFYLIFGEIIIDSLTNIPNVRVMAGEYLIWVIILPLISVWCFQFDGIFIGATAGKYMRNGMLLSALTYVTALILFIPPYDNHGLWLSYSIFMVSRAITLMLAYPTMIEEKL